MVAEVSLHAAVQLVQQTGSADDERVAGFDLEQACGAALDPFEVREVVGHQIVAEHRSRSGIGPDAVDWCPVRDAIRPPARPDSPVNFAARSLLA